MNTASVKTIGFWMNMVLTIVGLLLANGIIVSGQAYQAAGWITTILTALGFHMLNTGSTPPAPPAA